MQKLKKTFSLLITVLILLMTFTASAYAAEATQDGLKAQIIFEKENYGKNEEIPIKIIVKNTNNYDVQNVSIEGLIPDGLTLISDTATKSVDLLQSGETLELTYKIKLIDNITPSEPVTVVPTTEEPITNTTTTELPTENAATTETPNVNVPTTIEPITVVPTTKEPITNTTTTESPTENAATTETPNANVPTTIEPTTAYAENYQIGDVNNDKKITASDARLALRISAQLINATDLQIKAADTDNNGKITASDARKILRVSAKLDSFEDNSRTNNILTPLSSNLSDKKTGNISFMSLAVNSGKTISINNENSINTNINNIISLALGTCLSVIAVFMLIYFTRKDKNFKKRALSIMISVLIVLSSVSGFSLFKAVASNEERKSFTISETVTVDGKEYNIDNRILYEKNDSRGNEIILKSSEKELSTATEKTTVYFYAETKITENSIFLKCHEEYSFCIEMFKDDTGIYTCEAELDTSKEITYHFYAESNYSISNELNLKVIAPFTDEELDGIEIVDESIDNLFDSDYFEDSSTEEKVELFEILLFDLVDKGFIKETSIVYDEELMCFEFQYICGGTALIYIETNIDYNISGNNSFIDTYPAQNLINCDLVSQQNNITLSDHNQSAILIYDLWSKEENQDMYDFNQYVSSRWSTYGLPTDFKINSTVEFYKTGLLNRNIIFIQEHGIELKKNELYGFCLREAVTREATKLYSADKKEDRIYIEYTNNGKQYIIVPDFFSFYYENELNNSLIILGCCMGFGKGIVYDYHFSMAFTELCGACCVVGFHNSVYTDYATLLIRDFVLRIMDGYSITEALNIVKDVHGDNDVQYKYKHVDLDGYPDGGGSITWREILENHEEASPMIGGVGDTKLFNVGTITGYVKEENTNNPLVDVTVKATIGDFVRTTLTDENGEFSIKLPVGEWEISVEATDTHYCNEKRTVTVEKNKDVTLSPPFYMKNGAEVSGTVKDKNTDTPIANATIEVFDNSNTLIMEGIDGTYNYEDFKLGELITTTATDENGNYSLNLPSGKYAIAVNHDNYNFNGILLTIEQGFDEYLSQNILLTPKSEDVGKIAGQVNDTSNAGISDVLVEVYNEDSSELFISTQTDNTGQYSILLKHGIYNFKFSKDGYITKTLEIDYSDEGDFSITPVVVVLDKEPTGELGTKENPYKISTVEDLINIKDKPAACYKLVNDINLSGVSWEPIETFQGYLNGNGHSIINLNYTIDYCGYEGLFSINSGEITNLTIENLKINFNKVGATTSPPSKSTYLYVGAIAGLNEGSISECIVKSGQIQTTRSTYGSFYSFPGCTGVCAGGIAGINTGTISDCINSVTLNINSTYTSYIGGIAGDGDGQVIHCLNTGDIKCNTTGGGYRGYTTSYTGVFCAGISCSNSITNCANASNIIDVVVTHNYNLIDEFINADAYFIGPGAKYGNNNYSWENSSCSYTINYDTFVNSGHHVVTTEKNVTTTNIDTIKSIWNNYEF